MRLPLFITGFPQIPSVVADPVANPGDCLQVLDLRNLTLEKQSYTRFLTLCAWPADAVGGILDVYVQVGDETPYKVGGIYGSADIESTEPTSISFQIRGNVRVFVNQQSGTGAAVFGYVEIQDNLPSYEPLFPLSSSTVSPFNAVPLHLTVSDSDVAHQFENGYIDSISIKYSLSGNSSAVATFTFPNGVAIPTRVGSHRETEIMTGIPMLSTADDQEITVTTTADVTSLIVIGTFSRT